VNAHESATEENKIPRRTHPRDMLRFSMREKTSRRNPLSFIAIVMAGFAVAFFSHATPPAYAQTSNQQLNPIFSVPIPNLTLENVTVNTTTGIIDIPWIGDYVNGIYKYATAVAVILAIVMLMIGGFQYLTSGGNKTRVDAGKKRITDATIGLLLVFCAFILLSVINPSLVVYPALQIQTVKRIDWPVSTIPAQQMIAATGKPAIASSAMMKLATDKATALGGQGLACFVYASMIHESGGKQDAIGCDENYNLTWYDVLARKQFINSGVFYSGTTFPPVNCHSASCQNQGPTDPNCPGGFNINNPPDYGLDWRFNFSYGFGAGQSTVFAQNPPCPGEANMGRGFTVTGGHCYTIPELLDPDKQAEAMVFHYQTCWKSTNNGANPAAGYVCYAGTGINGGVNNPIIIERVNDFTTCMANGGVQ
jgi:hypothetical protein